MRASARRRAVQALFVGLLGAPAVVAASGGGFDQELFERFLAARVGSGDPVYWYFTGEVCSYPEGKLLARLEGIDTGRLLRPAEGSSTAQQLSRKLFVYRDPETNEVLREVGGKQVQHIQYPYQLISFSLEGDRLLTSVEQGSGPRLMKVGPLSHLRARRIDDVAIFSVPMFLSFETPRGSYEAFENYDFFIQPPSAARRHQLSWVRYGDLPAWLGEGKSVVHLVSWRVDRFEELPGTIREYVEQEAPLWREPPKDLQEVRALQRPPVPGGE